MEANKVVEEKLMYFQYNKKLHLPIFVKFVADHFEPELASFLRSMKFEEINQKEFEAASSVTVKNSRILNITEASVMVARQIAAVNDSDKFGPESLVQKNGYSVYRYSNAAMMVFSLSSHEWRMGCFSDFGHVANEMAYRIIINRFLSWSLAAHGIVGFWATPVEEGMVVQRAIDTKGEAVFVDIMKHRIITVEGEKRMKHSFSFIKLDVLLKDRSIVLKFEDLLGFLSVCCTYFGPQGLPTFVRQLIQTASRTYSGRTYPKENFRPRQDARLD